MTTPKRTPTEYANELICECKWALNPREIHKLNADLFRQAMAEARNSAIEECLDALQKSKTDGVTDWGRGYNCSIVESESWIRALLTQEEK